MSRADIPEEDRRDHYLYIDEFQNFPTSSFESILSEYRKYSLNLTGSHQYRAQLDDATAAAITGNVGSMVAFAVGNDDAAWLASAMSKSPGQFASHDLTNLPKYTACVRLLVDGIPSAPFTVRTPPPVIYCDRREVIRRQSQRRYARQVTEV